MFIFTSTTVSSIRTTAICEVIIINNGIAQNLSEKLLSTEPDTVLDQIIQQCSKQNVTAIWLCTYFYHNCLVQSRSKKTAHIEAGRRCEQKRTNIPAPHRTSGQVKKQKLCQVPTDLITLQHKKKIAKNKLLSHVLF